MQTPRSPSSPAGSLASIAVLARRSALNVPTRLIAMHALEGLQRVRAAAAREPLGVADARAADADAQAAGRRGGRLDGALQLRGVGDVGGDEARALAERSGERLAARRVEIGDDDVRAALVQRPRRRLAEPRGASDDERACPVDPHALTLAALPPTTPECQLRRCPTASFDRCR